MENVGRPDPDRLLRRLDEEEPRANRGKLVLFFGAAPGVGKTFAMLCEAQDQRADGREVVVGVVETHGRQETASLLSGLEILDRRHISYHGITLSELDLDAALQRRPALILVDELAHANAEGCRHPKRWQDVEELLDAGIDVYSTVDVQHVESLNDVVSQITGIKVHETIPDSILERAHEIRLVDLPPDELLERLKEGKVHVPEQARRATDHFFERGNLIALRELALRRTAERVDAQMRQYRRDQGITHTWAVSDRVLVCMSWSPYSAPLIRAACRIAQRLHAHWFAVYVETPTYSLSAQDRLQLSQNIRLAEQLGAEVVTLTGESAADEIVRFARKRNVTKIVVGKPRFLRWHERLFGSFLEQIVMKSGEIEVNATTGEHGADDQTQGPLRRRSTGRSGYLAAAAVVGLVSAVSGALFGRSQPADVVMLYLLGVMLVSMWYDYGPSLFAAVLSVLAFDFFFIPPYLTFAVADVRHVVTFGVLFMVAVVVSGLTRRVRAQADAARERERWTEALYTLSRELARAEATQTLIDVSARHVEEVFDCCVVVFTRDEADRQLIARRGHDRTDKTTEEAGIVNWVFENGREAGLGTTTLPGARALYLPLVGQRGKIGVLEVVPQDLGRFEDPTQRRLLEAFASQLAVALDRVLSAEETRRAKLDADREEFRSTLLSSVSHELRTPLAVMTGAASTLIGDEGNIPPPTRLDLLRTISDQAGRLNQLVGNILDMTRLESGAVGPKREWHPLEEIVGATLNSMEGRLQGHAVNVNLPDGLLLVHVDAVLIEQVLTHLLENAVKYSTEGSPIDVGTRLDEAFVVVEVADRGPGIPEAEKSRVFDKFYRLSRNRSISGTGLGLSICRAIVAAHGGRIWVEDRSGGGAILKFALPREETPPDTRREELPEASTE
ncbi:MAG: sensor histidine kinase KdpD [Candidatus Riflebacteria bacterium]|nr:sensor histidine kinase KdpD [Candidatus Riflebacteria bacterium]